MAIFLFKDEDAQLAAIDVLRKNGIDSSLMGFHGFIELAVRSHFRDRAEALLRAHDDIARKVIEWGRGIG